LSPAPATGGRGALLCLVVVALLAGVGLASESSESAAPHRSVGFASRLPWRPTPPASIRSAAKGRCERFAGPRGSDRGPGTRRRPYRTVKRLTRSLRRGQTGCLLRGRYRHRGVARIRRPAVTLRSVKGARARVDGTIWIDPSARGSRVMRLFLTTSDPAYPIPLKAQADRSVVSENVITGRRASTICLVIGSAHRARGVLVERNRITRCGFEGKYDHLVYLVHSRGAVLRWNVLTDNPGGWAVHLYPDADRTLVEHNVIDRNQGGVIFAGDGEDASDRNLVRNNAITFSTPRWNVEGSWSGGSPGDGNVAERNCLFTDGPSAPAGIGQLDGFSAADNTVVAGSPYVPRHDAAHRFAVGSPCATLVGDVVGPPVVIRTSRERSRRPRRR
jgi:hypothetical protein